MQETAVYTIHDFAKAFGIGRTKLYEEINAGRLRARKAGKRTLILKTDADDWVNSLPTLGRPGTS